jgi:hypothetical protein
MASERNKSTILENAQVRSDGTLVLDLWYPGLDESIGALEVGLMDVRAADSIRIRYDFERNGWSVLQASVFEWAADDTALDSDWQEVAFVPAWARQRIPPPEDEK